MVHIGIKRHTHDIAHRFHRLRACNSFLRGARFSVRWVEGKGCLQRGLGSMAITTYDQEPYYSPSGRCVTASCQGTSENIGEWV